LDYSSFDNLIDVVFVLDDEKNVLYCNTAASTFLNISIVRLQKGKPIHKFVTIDDPKCFISEDGVFNEHIDTNYKELSFQSSKNREGKILISVNKLEAKNHYLIYIRDMTLEECLHGKYQTELKSKEKVIEELKNAQTELKRYSEQLEEMVEKRTNELKETNLFMKTMINSLEQGLFVFDEEGTCLPHYTRICDSIFDTTLKGQKVWDILSSTEMKKDAIKTWADGIFKEMIPFDHYAKLGPISLINNNSQHIELEYFAMRNDDDKIKGIVAVATDKTKEVEALREAKEESEKAKMITKLVSSKDQFISFLSTAKDMCKELKIETTKTPNEFNTRKVFNLIHSLKGGSSLFSIYSIEKIAHKYEDTLMQMRDNETLPSSEDIMFIKNGVNRIYYQLEIFMTECQKYLGDAVIDGISRIEIKLDVALAFADKIKMNTPRNNLYDEFNDQFIKRSIQDYFSSYKDMVYDIAADQGKKIESFNLINGNLKIHPTYFGNLFNTLVHSFRNSIDHGLEDPMTRKSVNKTEGGNITIHFSIGHVDETDWLSINIIDDGQGIPPEVIREKLENINIAHKQLTDHEVIQHVFSQGLSTKEEVTELSGRGVGMDAIKGEVIDYGGHVEVYSQIGKGTQVVIVVPIKDVENDSIEQKVG
jgi:two-component system chemotaxis sensor kinase CheA